ncbi:hypothetical protein Droror1_Dr00027079 [Drosera rotundifolia]
MISAAATASSSFGVLDVVDFGNMMLGCGGIWRCSVVEVIPRFGFVDACKVWSISKSSVVVGALSCFARTFLNR